jgi:hypothetical protein
VSYHRRARVASRVPPSYLLVLVLGIAGLAGLGYVAFRMVSAGSPRISLAAPFDKVGRRSTLA